MNGFGLDLKFSCLIVFYRLRSLRAGFVLVEHEVGTCHAMRDFNKDKHVMSRVWLFAV